MTTTTPVSFDELRVGDRIEWTQIDRGFMPGEYHRDGTVEKVTANTITVKDGNRTFRLIRSNWYDKFVRRVTVADDAPAVDTEPVPGDHDYVAYCPECDTHGHVLDECPALGYEDAETGTALDTVADALLSLAGGTDEPTEVDMTETFEALRKLLPTHHVTALAARLELCPVHYCDAAICADDDVTECAEARA